MNRLQQSPSSQNDLFSSNQGLPPEFAELCNALYERELHYLAVQGPKQISLLQRRLSGLSHHIKRAARFLAQNNVPIDVDTHNASWQAKQAKHSPARVDQNDKTSDWYQRHAQPGLVVCIRVQQLDCEHIELDAIDRVQAENQTLHLNKFGWFNFAGLSLNDSPDANAQLTLQKPTKALFTAACCGHCWNHKGRVLPRTLTLRELLLSTTINWKNFAHRATAVNTR